MKKVVLLVAALTLSACAGTGPTQPEESMAKVPDATDYDGLVKQANDAISKANAMGGEWRDSRMFLEQAEEAKKAGDNEKAMKLAKKAKSEGELAAKQAASQAKAGPWLF